MIGAEMLVLIRGAGDLASGVAARLHWCGFPVVMTELSQPLVVRRTVAFAEAVYDGEIQVEDIRACRAASTVEARRNLAEGAIPLLVDPEARCRAELNPAVVVDAIMAKRNTGTRITDAPLVVALGPGFTAGVDCHAVIETNRGHRLGRAIYSGSAEPDTGAPGEVGGRTVERILRAPVAGVVEGLVSIGEVVRAGQAVAMIGAHPIRAGADGVLRGMVRTGIAVSQGTKIGDVDPRGVRSHSDLISDKALAIAGGVLEAILRLSRG